jgi:hypothetical protein
VYQPTTAGGTAVAIHLDVEVLHIAVSFDVEFDPGCATQLVIQGVAAIRGIGQSRRVDGLVAEHHAGDLLALVESISGSVGVGVRQGNGLAIVVHGAGTIGVRRTAHATEHHGQDQWNAFHGHAPEWKMPLHPGNLPAGITPGGFERASCSLRIARVKTW